MRKVVVSFIAGLLVAIGVNAAYAEVATMIGKQVDGQFPLKIGGELSEIPAITIEGVSYIPLRAAGELFGAQVSWLDGEIIMEYADREQDRPSQTPEELAEIARIEQERFDQEATQKNEELLQKSRLRSQIEGQIMTINFQIERLQHEIESREENLRNPPEYVEPNVPYEGSDLQRKHQEDLARLKDELADLEAQLAELDQQKAELEAQQ